MANAKSGSKATMSQRVQVADAVLQGYLDSALAADLSTAQSNGYAQGKFVDSVVSEAPIGGINR